MSDDSNQRKRRITPAYLGRDLVGRGKPRYRVDLTVTVNSETTFYAGNARDLSSGGLFVDTPIVHPVGTRFSLSLHVDDGIDRVVRGIGEVRWVRHESGDALEPSGVGIRFVELEADGASRLKRFLESGRAGPPSAPRASSPSAPGASSPPDSTAGDGPPA